MMRATRIFPRSTDRGPIEAFAIRVPVFPADDNFRGQLTAAPLKLMVAAASGVFTATNFRGQLTAAPLKQRPVVLGDKPLWKFPRSTDRGPIEAIGIGCWRLHPSVDFRGQLTLPSMNRQPCGSRQAEPVPNCRRFAERGRGILKGPPLFTRGSLKTDGKSAVCDGCRNWPIGCKMTFGEGKVIGTSPVLSDFGCLIGV